MAHPSDKTTRSKRGMRRSHDALEKPSTATCPNCGALIRPHRVCQDCGHYKNREVLRVK